VLVYKPANSSISCIAVYSEQYPSKVSSNDLMKIGDSSSGLVSDCICLWYLVSYGFL